MRSAPCWNRQYAFIPSSLPTLRISRLPELSARGNRRNPIDVPRLRYSCELAPENGGTRYFFVDAHPLHDLRLTVQGRRRQMRHSAGMALSRAWIRQGPGRGRSAGSRRSRRTHTQIEIPTCVPNLSSPKDHRHFVARTKSVTEAAVTRLGAQCPQSNRRYAGVHTSEELGLERVCPSSAGVREGRGQRSASASATAGIVGGVKNARASHRHPRAERRGARDAGSHDSAVHWGVITSCR